MSAVAAAQPVGLAFLGVKVRQNTPIRSLDEYVFGGYPTLPWRRCLLEESRNPFKAETFFPG